MKKMTVLCLMMTMSLMACDSSKKKGTDEPVPVPTPTPAVVVDKVDTKTPAVDDKTDKPADSAMEKDDNMTTTVVKKAWSKTLPEGFELKGTALYYASWTDKNGLNGIGITQLKNKKGGGLILVKHATLEGDGSWSEMRGMKELLETCDFDLIQNVHMDKAWSLTDLDKDGIGEASFAWTSDCTSDVSPNKHKAFIIEGGEKFALRGVTKVYAGKQFTGGTFKQDATFAKAPPTFLAHAKKVWNATSGTK